MSDDHQPDLVQEDDDFADEQGGGGSGAGANFEDAHFLAAQRRDYSAQQQMLYEQSEEASESVMRLNLNGEQLHMGDAAAGSASAAASSSAAAAASGGGGGGETPELKAGGETIVRTREVLSCIKCDTVNGHVYMGSYTGELILFDFASHREVWRRQITLDNGKAVSISCLDIKGTKLALGCSTGETLIYDLESFTVAQCWGEHRARVSGIAWVVSSSGENHVYSVSHDGYFLVRDADKKGRVLHSFTTCTCPLSSLVVEPQGGVAYVGSWDGQVKRLDLERKLVTLVLKSSSAKESPVRALALAPAPPAPKKTGKKSAGEAPPAFILLVVHGQGELKSWNLGLGVVHVESYLGCGDVINSLAVFNGRVYAGGDDKHVRMFDLHSGALLDSLGGHENGVTSLCIAGVTPVLTEEQKEAMAAAAAASASHRSSSSRAKSAAKGPAPEGQGNELLLSVGFDGQARAFKIAAVEAGVQLRLLRAEESKALAFEAFVASKTKGKKAGSRKGSAKGKKKAAGSGKKASSSSTTAGGSKSGSKTGSKAATARSTASAGKAKA